MTSENKPHETGSPSTDKNEEKTASNKQTSGAIAVKSVIPKHR